MQSAHLSTNYLPQESLQDNPFIKAMRNTLREEYAAWKAL
jgi:hypothetical protein